MYKKKSQVTVDIKNPAPGLKNPARIPSRADGRASRPEAADPPAPPTVRSGAAVVRHTVDIEDEPQNIGRAGRHDMCTHWLRTEQDQNQSPMEQSRR